MELVNKSTRLSNILQINCIDKDYWDVVFANYLIAITLISTFTPNGNLLTCTVSRAG